LVKHAAVSSVEPAGTAAAIGSADQIPVPGSELPSTTPKDERTVVLASDAQIETRANREHLDLGQEQRRLMEAIAVWRFSDYQRASGKDRITGEAAYQTYLYVKSCVGNMTTAAQYERQLSRVQVLYARNRERVSEGQLSHHLGELEAGFQRCEGLGEQVLTAAVEWLQLAADLGYLPAQLRFYRELPELLAQERWAVFRQPEFLDLYQQRGADYLDSALQSGHPEAFRHYAAAIAEGILFEPDPVLSVAFHHAADLAENKGPASLQAADPVSGLGARQLRDARQIGEDLCSRYCL
jgi:TPR repeat protein